jgi:PAS domain S-box-containing protein
MSSSLPGGATAVLAAAEALPYGLAITDPNGEITFANAAYAQLAGCTPDELPGQSAGEFPWDALAHTVPSPQPWPGETVYRSKRGEAYSGEHSITTLRDPAGEVAGFWIMKRDATELNRPAGLPYEAEDNLLALIESTDDLVWSVDLNFRLLTFNRAMRENFEDNFGFRAAVGARPEDLMPPARAALWPPMYERALTEGPFRAEYTLVDGRTLELSINPIRHDGRTAGVSVFGKDITERKAADKALREAEREYRSIFDGAVEGIYRTTIHGRSLTANPALARILGYESPQELVSTLTDTTHQLWLDPSERSHFFGLVNEQEVVRNYECQFKRKDGTAVWVALNIQKVQDRGTAYYEGFIEDITDRKQAEQERQQTEQRYRSLFDSMQEGVAIHKLVHTNGTPENYILLEVNRRYEEILGVRREDVVNKLATNVYGIQDAPYLTEYASVVETGTPLHFETYFPPMDKHFLISVASMGDDRFATLFFDITEQKKNERAIQQAYKSVAKGEAHYRLMFNSVSDALFVHKFGEDGLPGHFLEVNDNACRCLGYTREELLQMGPLDLDAPEEHSDLAIRSHRILADGHLIWEGTHIAKDGRRVPVEVNTHLVDLNGEPTLISSVRDISDRKEIEKNYRHVFDGALEGIFRTSLDGRALLANPALATMLGYDSVEQYLSEMNDSARQVWMDPNERSRYLSLFELQGIIRGYECQLKRRDGNPVWVSLNSRKVCGEDGQILYSEGFIEDITERRRDEEFIKTSENKFRMAFMTGADAFSIATLNEGLILDVNDRFAEVFGYPADEARGKTSTQLGLYANHDRGRLISELTAKGYVSNLEFEALRKNGERRSVVVSASVMESTGEQLILVVVKDITEEKRAEAGLKTLTTAVEQANETIVITDLNGTIQYCNPAFSKVTGYSKEEAVGQNPRVLKSGQHDAEFYRQMWATITQGQVWSGHLTNKRKDGSLYEESGTISPIRDASGKISGFVAVKRDVTEHRKLEDQLRQAQKLESIGRLAGGVAHDFNNLLTVINGYSGLLLRSLKPGDPLRSYAEEISTAGDRAAGLTKQLLAFSRKQVIEPKVVDLNAIIRESAAMLQRLIGDDIALETHLDISLGRVMADPDQIHQIIMNLAVNARDAMSDGGALDIETLNCELTAEDGAGGRGGQVPGRYVLMTVTDTGHGMDETVRKQIFEPFFTTKGVGKGTGLGLSTVYGIVQQNGGWIDAWSEVGVGTTFKLYLPRIDACAVEVEERSVSAGGGGETILLVEDQEAVRSFAKAVLRQHGYQVIHAGDGDQALSVVKLHSGPIHLLLTDVVMPGLNGRELSVRLRELCPDLKVLFISGYTADVIAQRGVLDPGVAFLHKPFSQEELAQKVREVLDRAF